VSKTSTIRQATMSDSNDKSKDATKQATMSDLSDDKAMENCTTAAFCAIDEFDVQKLREALAMGAAVGDTTCTLPSNSDSNTHDSRSMSLIEYAVFENFSDGVDIMLKVCLSSSFVHVTHIGPVRLEPDLALGPVSLTQCNPTKPNPTQPTK